MTARKAGADAAYLEVADTSSGAGRVQEQAQVAEAPAQAENLDGAGSGPQSGLTGRSGGDRDQ